VCPVAASKLLRNQRKTGVCEVVSPIVWYDPVVNCSGSQVGGWAVASAFVLKDDRTIHMNGITYRAVRITKAVYDSGRA
jgi:hypothetical protein